MHAEVRSFAPLTSEMRFWQRVLRPILRPPPGLLGQVMTGLRFVLVTPTAHAAWLSSSFQLYLYAVFHQTGLARSLHRIGFPLTILALCAALAPYRIGPAPTSLGAALLTPSLALLGSGLLAIYHVYVAAFFRSAVLGLVVVPLGLGLYAAGVGWAWSLGNLGPTPEAPWWPIVAALLMSAMVSLSHAREPMIPPRVSGTDAWVSLGSFLLGAPGSPGRGWRALRTAVAVLGGVLDELWGAPRLLVLSVLCDLERLGLRASVSRDAGIWARDALRSGNPALDFIGIGGGAPPP